VPTDELSACAGLTDRSYRRTARTRPKPSDATRRRRRPTSASQPRGTDPTAPPALRSSAPHHASHGRSPSPQPPDRPMVTRRSTTTTRRPATMANSSGPRRCGGGRRTTQRRGWSTSGCPSTCTTGSVNWSETPRRTAAADAQPRLVIALLRKAHDPDEAAELIRRKRAAEHEGET